MAAGAVAAPVRGVQAVRRPGMFYRDPISCLQSTLGTLVIEHGHDPLEALGAGWEFRYLPGQVRTEEFYYPCRYPDDLARSVAPHHPIRSAWHTAPGDEPLAVLADTIAAGGLPIAAVDNYHLPFRPAYHDVHAAHLVVVYGVDPGRGLVLVSDAMPPEYSGPIRAEDFLAAWDSANPTDEQDAFFSDAPIARRYLNVEIGVPYPALDQAGLAAAVRANLAGFAAAADDAWCGLAGVARYAALVRDAARDGDGRLVREVYPFGWGMQAQSCLHGELLRRQGERWRLPALREAGRRVEAVGYAWTGLRVTAAHTWPDPGAAAPSLARHATRLNDRYQAAVEAVAAAAERM